MAAMVRSKLVHPSASWVLVVSRILLLLLSFQVNVGAGFAAQDLQLTVRPSPTKRPFSDRYPEIVGKPGAAVSTLYELRIFFRLVWLTSNVQRNADYLWGGIC